MPRGEEPLSRDDRVNEAIAAYLEAVERGETPDREQFLTDHAEIAPELTSFFANQAQFREDAGSLPPVHGGIEGGPGQNANGAVDAPQATPRSSPPLQTGEGGMSVDSPAQAGTPTDPTMAFQQRDVPSGKEVLRYFGEYELLQEIARGGMGVVYRARQVRLNRIVAVKMILSGRLASPEDVDRFHTEAEAAAKLDHPGIVPIYEVGQHEGQHYFSMGFVEGQSLSARVAQGPLPGREAAELVKTVAAAVQYAHANGVIHRDLKPGNILLDRHGNPRITDFGLAKLTESQSDVTGTGQVLGTPGYMPPEQAAAKASSVGHLADIYSLGAILYCLLTGRPPFQAATPVETLLQVQQQEPVPPRQLNPAIPLDLETIVLKCLEKSPARRYSTAQDVAAELQRFLDGRPIVARPVGSVERTWRWCRRNPLVAGLMTTVAVSLIAGTAVSTYFAIEANDRAKSETRQRQIADKERRAANLQETRAIAAQEQSADSLKDALAAVEQMLTRVAQERLANVPQMEPVRKELLEDALKFYQKFLQKNNDDPLIRRETAGAYRRMADIYRRLGRNAEAEEYYRKAFEMFEELESSSALEPSLRRDLSMAHFEVATCCRDLERPAEQESHNRLAVELAEDLTREFPGDPLYGDQFAYAALQLSEVLAPTRPEEAERILRRILTLATSPHNLGICHMYFGSLLASQGKSSEAVAMFRKALEIFEKIAASESSAHSPQWVLGDILTLLARALAGQGQLQEAEALNARAIVILDKLATDYPAGPDYRYSQAAAYDIQGEIMKKLSRTAEAEQTCRRALDLFTILSDDFPNTLGSGRTAIDQHLNFGQFLEQLGRTDDALQIYRRAIGVAEKRIAINSRRLNQWYGLVRTHVELARLLAKCGQAQEAEAAFRRAVEIQETLQRAFGDKPEDRRDLAQSLLQASELLGNTGRWEEAEKVCRMAVESHATLTADFPNEPMLRQNLASCYVQLALALAGRGQNQEVSQIYGLCIDTWKTLATDFPQSQEYRFRLAEASFRLAKWSRGTQPKAAELAYREALALGVQLAAEHPDVPAYHRQAAYYRTDLAFFLLETGRADEAETVVRQAVAWAEGMAADPAADMANRRIAGMAYRILAVVLKAKARPQEAENAFRVSGEIYSKLAADFPSEPEYLQLIGLTQGDLAGLLAGQGRNKESEEDLRQTIARLNELAAQYPDVPRHRYLLAIDHNLLANLLASGGQLPRAQEERRAALALYEKLAADFPHEPSYRSQVGWLCRALASGPEAEEMQRRDISTFASLTDEFPDNPLWPGHLAHAFRLSADYLIAQRRPHEAVQAFLQAIKVLEKSTAKFPGAAREHGTLLADTHRVLAALLVEQGQWEEAVAAFSRAIELRSEDLDGVWLPLALLRLKAGQTEDYRRLVSTALDRFGATEELAVATNLGILAKLAPGASDDVAAALKVLERALARRPDDGFALAIRAHLLIRAGRAAEGVPIIEGMVAATPDGQGDQRFNLLFLAMGRQQLGRNREALEAFRAAEHWQDKRFNAWFHRIDFGRTCDEVELLLNPSGSEQTTDARSAQRPLPASRTLEGYTATVWCAAYSPDGTILATGGDDNTICLWDAKTGAPLRTLPGHMAQVRHLAFSRDGSMLASSSFDKTIRLWDPKTGDLQATLEDSAGVYLVAFSKDGKRLVAATAESGPRIWNIPDRKLIRKLEGHTGTAWAVALSPHDDRIATAGTDMLVKIWNADSGDLIRTLSGHASEVGSAAFSPDGRIVASAGGNDKTARLWESGTGGLLHALPCGVVYEVAFSPDGTLLATSCSHETVRLWEVKTGQLRHTFAGGGLCVAFSPDGKHLAGGGEDKLVYIWDVRAARKDKP